MSAKTEDYRETAPHHTQTQRRRAVAVPDPIASRPARTEKRGAPAVDADLGLVLGDDFPIAEAPANRLGHVAFLLTS